MEIYEHKFSKHPENPMEFNPNKYTVKDMILHLIAEQNLEIMDVVLDLKKNIRAAIEDLSNDVKENVEDYTESAFVDIYKRIYNLEKKNQTFPRETQCTEPRVQYQETASAPPCSRQPPLPPPPESRTP